MSDVKPGQTVMFWPVKRNSPGEYPGVMTALPAILAHLNELEDGSKTANVLVIEKGAGLTPMRDVKFVESADDQPDDEQFVTAEGYTKTEGKDERIEKEAKERAEKEEAERAEREAEEAKRKEEAEISAAAEAQKDEFKKDGAPDTDPAAPANEDRLQAGEGSEKIPTEPLPGTQREGVAAGSDLSSVQNQQQPASQPPAQQ